MAASAIPGVETVAGGTYCRTIEVAGAIGSVSVAHEPHRSRLLATIRFPRTAALPAIIARLRRMFDLGADPDVIGAALSQDARLAPLVAAHPGLRVPGAWDGFELGVRAILGQRMTVAAATKLAGGIAQAWGAPFTAAGAHPDLTRVFPGPQVLASASLTGVAGGPAGAIVGLARAVQANPAVLERGADLAESISRLRALPGIDGSIADYIAMRAMREPDAFPASHLGLWQALPRDSGRRDEATLRREAEAWRPWRAYAAMHLWHARAGTAETEDALAA